METFCTYFYPTGGAALPLSHLPQECGYSVYKTLVGLVFLVPYDGCDVMKQVSLLCLLTMSHQKVFFVVV